MNTLIQKIITVLIMVTMLVSPISTTTPAAASNSTYNWKNNVAGNHWVIAEDRNKCSEFSIDKTKVYNGSPYSIKLVNKDYNISYVNQTFSVKPNTTYRFSAMVNYSGFVLDPQAEGKNSGASIGTDFSYSRSEGKTGGKWERLVYDFTTDSQSTEYTLSLNNGLWDAKCKGTAWFTDIKLEEAVYSNEWNVLCIVFKNIDADVTRDGIRSVYKKSFNADDIKTQKTILDNFKTEISKMSGGLLKINNIDIVTTEATITELIPYDYTDEYGVDIHSWQPNMKSKAVKKEVNKILENTDKVYQQIFYSIPTSTKLGWAGLGGGEFNGIKTCLQVFSGDTYDIEWTTLVWIHEVLHTLEAATKKLGTDITKLHARTVFGYAKDNAGEYQWDIDYLCNKIKGGKGVNPRAFNRMSAYKTVYVDMASTDIATKKKYKVSFNGAKVSSQTVEYMSQAVEPQTPVKKGYRFGGWYTDKSYTTKFDFYQPIVKNTKVYALMTKIQSGDSDFTIIDGKITEYKGKGGTVTIPADICEIDPEVLVKAENVKSFKVAKGNRFFTSIDGVLFTKDKKTLVAFPKAKTGDYTLPSGTETIGENAFRYADKVGVIHLNKGLKTIKDYGLSYGKTIDKLPNSLQYIGFSGLLSLKNSGSITIPSKVSMIGNWAFGWSNNLREITIKGNIKELSRCLFYKCYNLEKVTLPASLVTMGDKIFTECENLTDIYFEGTKSQWKAIDISNANIPEKCKIHFKK